MLAISNRSRFSSSDSAAFFPFPFFGAMFAACSENELYLFLKHLPTLPASIGCWAESAPSESGWSGWDKTIHTELPAKQKKTAPFFGFDIYIFQQLDVALQVYTHTSVDKIDMAVDESSRASENSAGGTGEDRIPRFMNQVPFSRINSCKSTPWTTPNYVAKASATWPPNTNKN